MNSITSFSDLPTIPRAIIYSYFDEDDANKITQVFVEYFPNEVRYPLHFFDQTVIGLLRVKYSHRSADVVYAQSVIKHFASEPLLLNKTFKDPQNTAAVHAFERGSYKLAVFYIKNKIPFPIEGRPSIQAVEHLYWDWPSISTAVSNAIWNNRKKNTEAVQHMLNAICRRGNAVFLEQFFQKMLKEDRPFIPSLKFGKALIEAINGGFCDTVKTLSSHINFQVFDERQKSAVVGLCVDMGYPKIVSILNFPISEKQQKTFQELTVELDRAKQDHANTSPAAITTAHYNGHGGRANEALYQKEFKKAVAYAHFYLSHHEEDEDCYSQLLINLGKRRHRMAILGRLIDAHDQGILCSDAITMRTDFNDCYPFADRIKQKYKGETVTVYISYANEVIELTKITPQGWVHPIGKNGRKVLLVVNDLCKEMKKTMFFTEKEFVEKIGTIIWLLAHGAPWSRGTPTITYSFVDALCKLYGFAPINKAPDLICEALMYNRPSEFIEQLVARKDLFITGSAASKPLFHGNPIVAP